jgi:hypothetical protein
MQNYELYENILVRHGLMPMSCGASTKANQILGMSLTNMKEQGLEEKSVFYMMNPRSIFQKRLENRLVSPRPIGKPEP